MRYRHTDSSDPDALRDENGYVICKDCGAVLFLGSQRVQGIIDAGDRIARSYGLKTVTERISETEETGGD